MSFWRQHTEARLVHIGGPGIAPTTYRQSAFAHDPGRHSPIVRTTDEERAIQRAHVLRQHEDALARGVFRVRNTLVLDLVDELGQGKDTP